MINVTKTYLPDKEKYKNYIDQIFDSGWLTNNGQFVCQLEERLKKYLGVEYIILVASGTLALQVAYRLLGIKGEVITTPFTFVATVSSLVWEGLNPVFSDIHPESLTLDPTKIIEKINKNTSAIVPVHVFGNVCDIEKIEQISRHYGLKVIYDAAHAFDVKYKGRSVLQYGDISVLSFHATKTFHTIEGGAIVLKDRALYDQAKWMINFGINGSSQIVGLGINAKMNEFQAAMGLCLLDDMELITTMRKRKYEVYTEGLKGLPNITLPLQNPDSTQNYGYFPVIFKSESVVKNVIEKLNSYCIFPRRYFYPSLNTLPYITPQQAPVSSDIANRILCLPLYGELEAKDQKIVIDVIHDLCA